MLRSINGFFLGYSKFQIMAISFLFIAIVGVIDELTGWELSFSLFYLVPVAISAWYAGKPTGIMISIVSAATWFAIDFSSEQPHTHILIPIWNACVRLGFFIIVAFLLWRLRSALEYQASLAQHDGLTGILNNRAFKQQCYTLSKLASRHGHPMVLGYLDLDDFKMVNDSDGHSAGDQVLREVANTLSNRVRATDLVGRMGGDEFAILLPETDLRNAKLFFNELRNKLMDMAEQNSWAVGFSIGVAVFTNPPKDPEETLKYADELMYKVKHSGKNSILFKEYSAEFMGA